VFTPKALLDRLDRRLQLLGGGARDLPERQQTLRGTVAWSYDLLDAEEQTLFRRLAVFAGGCTLEAVEAVCDPGTDGSEQRDILETLASLVDNSLLVAQTEASARRRDDEGPRFFMLETIREYAAERLESSGEAEALQCAHALYYLQLAEAVQPETSVQMQEVWLTVLDAEHDNLRAALGDPEPAEGHRYAAVLDAVAVLVHALLPERGPPVDGGGAGAGCCGGPGEPNRGRPRAGGRFCSS
jgi:predicted ATPase